MPDLFELLKKKYGVGATKEEEIYLNVLAAVAGALLEYRKRHKLSQQQLAKKLGTSQAMVSKIETGSVNLSLKVLARIASKLGGDLKVQLEINPDEKVVKPVYPEFPSESVITEIDQPETLQLGAA